MGRDNVTEASPLLESSSSWQGKCQVGKGKDVIASSTRTETTECMYDSASFRCSGNSDTYSYRYDDYTSNDNNNDNTRNMNGTMGHYLESSERTDENDDVEDQSTDPKAHSHSSGKNIGMIGSLSIAVNSLAGPAILQLPFQFQHSGLIPTTVCLICVATLSALCCLHMANTVSKMNKNSNFDQQVEFSDPFRFFWGERAYKATQILFFLTTICLNVAAIVDTAEVVDSVFGLYSTAYGISFDHVTPELKSWDVYTSTMSHRDTESKSHNITSASLLQLHNNLNDTSIIDHGISNFNATSLDLNTTDFDFGTSNLHSCTREEVKLGLCDPFNDVHEYGHFLLTIGYILTAVVFLPICLKDLKENTAWQIFGFGILLSLSAYFCACFASVIDVKDVLDFRRVSLWGHSWGGMLGVIMFNFALVLAIPAWLHEKQTTVSVRKTVIQSTVISTTLYIAVGIAGALAIPHVNVNMLSPMVSGAYGTGMQYAGTFFAFFIIGLDIPLFCVLTRYNLTHSGLCSVRTANWLVVYIPWALSWIFYQGDSIGVLLSWGGVLLTSAAAFILPLYLSLRALRMTNINLGSVRVYCGSCSRTLSRRNQIRALQFLLLLACGSVVCAIFGQLTSRKHLKAVIHSKQYLNSTETLAVLRAARKSKAKTRHNDGNQQL